VIASHAAPRAWSYHLLPYLSGAAPVLAARLAVAVTARPARRHRDRGIASRRAPLTAPEGVLRSRDQCRSHSARRRRTIAKSALSQWARSQREAAAPLTRVAVLAALREASLRVTRSLRLRAQCSSLTRTAIVSAKRSREARTSKSLAQDADRVHVQEMVTRSASMMHLCLGGYQGSTSCTRGLEADRLLMFAAEPAVAVELALVARDLGVHHESLLKATPK
jgi:hypothetical protein